MGVDTTRNVVCVGIQSLTAKGGLEHRNHPIDISVENASNKGKIPSAPKN